MHSQEVIPSTEVRTQLPCLLLQKPKKKAEIKTMHMYTATAHYIQLCVTSLWLHLSSYRIFPFLSVCIRKLGKSLGTLILVHSCVIVLHCIPNMTHYQLDSFRAKCSNIKGYDRKHSILLSNNYIKTTNKITANRFSKTN